MKRIHFLLSLLLLISLANGLWAQPSYTSREFGRRLGHFYSAKKIGGQFRSFTVLQDERGLIYIGNSRILEYDGVITRDIPLPKPTTISDLVLGEQNRIYVAGYNEMGYLTPDSTGELRFQSLTSLVPDSLQKEDLHWRTKALGREVFFWTNSFILQVDQQNHQLKKIWTHVRGLRLYVIGQYAYIWRMGIGPGRIEGDRLLNLPTSLSEEEDVYLTASFQASDAESSIESDVIAYVPTSPKAEQIPSRTGLKPVPVSWKPEIASLWESGKVTDLQKLGEHGHVLTTKGGDLLLLDPQGNFIEPLNKATGLFGVQSAHPNIWLDDAQSLWVVPGDEGIARIEPFSPFSEFGQEEFGIVTAIIRHQGYIYIGTRKHIFRLLAADRLEAAARWEKICDLENVFGFHSDGENLYASAVYGVYLINPEAKNPAQVKYQSMGDYLFIKSSTYDPTLLYAGSNSSIKILKKEKGGFSLKGEIQTGNQTETLVETTPDTIWLGSFNGGLKRFVFPDSMPKVIKDLTGEVSIPGELKSFQEEEGMPAGIALTYSVGGELLVTSSQGYRRYDPSSDAMIPETRFGPQMADANTFTFLTAEDAKGRVYTLLDFTELAPTQRAGISCLTPDGKGKYTLENKLFHRLPQIQLFGATALYPDPENPDILWVIGKGVTRFDAAKAKAPADSFRVYVRRIRSVGDSIIYHNDGGSPAYKQVDFSLNSLRFEFAAPFFQNEEETRYRVMLEGFDEKWSSWKDETYAVYTNLSEGTYYFRVQARNNSRIISESAPMKVVILPPWYRSAWAYALYGLLALLFVAALVYFYNRWQTRQLQARNQELSQVVEERTAELKVKNERLKELDDFKSQFFTNISHEFRTPLTVIGGMMDQVITQPDRWLEKGGQLIKRNVGNLLNLINQILDLRKLESGNLQLQLIQEDVIPFLRYGTESFESYASSRSLDLQFQTDLDSQFMDHDPDKLLLIQTNLLSNAIKFTPEGGKVMVSVEKTNGNTLQLQVSDTGRGIPPSKLSMIFDRFYQVDQSDTREGEGTGIGLSLTKALVELMEGEIQVKSEMGKGSVFTVFLPIQHNAPLQSAPSPQLEIPPLPQEGTLIPTPSTVEGERPSLLIIEDNPDIVSYLYACLDGQYELSSAPDGQAGIEAALEQVPDLILTDVMMPYKNGYEVTETLKLDERTSHIPIVMLTAKADHDSRMEGYKRGADAYLAKPFNEEELHIRLQKLHELRTKLQARYQGSTPPTPSEDPAIQQEDAFVIRVRELILANLDDSTYKGEALMKDLGIGRTNLHRKIKALTGLPISRFIHGVRIEQARKLLRAGELHVAEVAYAVGYNDPTYFNRMFREAEGQSPGEWREQELGNKS
ncbi:MAG: ATP-binding protein [Bacteroidia bacterium]|nr:ATP-binding protein [Bacteroidia bacterium]